MAKKKISGLPASGALTGTEIVPIVQSGTTKRTTTQAIADLGGGGGISGSGTANYVSKWSDGTTLTDSLFYSDANVAKTIHSGVDKGLYIDFVNDIYLLGNEGAGWGNMRSDNNTVTIGDTAYNNFGTKFIVDDTNQIIKTQNPNDKGIILDFASNFYLFGNADNAPNQLAISGNELILGDAFNNINSTKFIVDDSVQIIKTQSQGADNGLYIDFTNNISKFGVININGIKVGISNTQIGDYDFDDTGTILSVDRGNEIIKTSSQGADKGLYIDYPNYIYALGFTDGGNPFTDPVDGFVYTSDYTTIGSRWNWGEYIEIAHNVQRVNLETNRLHYRNLTTTEINALTGNLKGDVVFNSTLNVLCFYDGSGWRKVSHSAM